MQQERKLGSAWGGVIALLGIALSLLFQGWAWIGGDIKTIGALALTVGTIFTATGAVLVVSLSARNKKR